MRDITPPSEILVEAGAHGDLSAWRALYDRHLPALWRYVYARTGGDHALAEDVVGETVLALVAAIGSLNPESGRLAGWLARVARSKLHDHRRKQGRAARAAATIARRDRPNGLAHAPATLEEAETRAQVLAVMGQLADEARLALEWKYVEGLSVREIALRLGRTEKAAESILLRARRSFRRLFRRVSQSKVTR